MLTASNIDVTRFMIYMQPRNVTTVLILIERGRLLVMLIIPITCVVRSEDQMILHGNIILIDSCLNVLGV